MTISDQNEVRDQVRERREEEQLFRRFQNVATAKLESLSKQTKQDQEDGFGSNLDQAGKLEFGEEEQRIISRMTGMGLKEGILASIASFVILRRGPKYIGRWVQRRSNNNNHHQPSSSYQLSDPKKLNTNNSSNPFERAAQQKDFPRPRGFVSRSIWFVFDTVLSLMVGANVSMVYTDKDAIRQQITELPLVSGRSLAADALCDEMVQELRKVQQEKNPAYKRLEKMNHTEPTAASFFLEGIVQFCHNCERRRYLEKKIREQSGLEQMAPVNIPIPGVPSDGPRLVESSNNDGDTRMEDHFLADEFGKDTTSWANDFTLDGFGSDQDGRR